MITGLSATGEPLAPHFQFPTKAKNKDKMKIEYEMLEKMKLVNGQFGSETEREWGSGVALTGWMTKKAEWMMMNLKSFA